MDNLHESLKLRYPNLHPLIFQRSVEKAKSNGELFDILEEVNSLGMPVMWDDNIKKWKKCEDLVQKICIKE